MFAYTDFKRKMEMEKQGDQCISCWLIKKFLEKKTNNNMRQAFRRLKVCER